MSNRKLGGAFKGLLLVVLVCGVVFGSRILIKRWVFENPHYALDDIRVTTDGLLTRAQVLEIMEIQDGKNIFSVDLSKARKALDLMPQVERVDIRRVLPSRIDVRILERQPIAWVAPSPTTELGVDGRAFLVDTRGYVMRTRKVLPEHLALPVITGVVMEDVAPGQKLPTSEAFSAVELIKLSAEDLRWQARVVDVSKGYCIVVTDQRKAKVTFSFDNIEGQLSRLRQIIDYVEPTQREFQSVNLMLERSVPIVFAPPPAPVVPAQETKSGKGKAGVKNVGASGVSGGVPNPAVQSVSVPAFASPKAGAATPAALPHDPLMSAATPAESKSQRAAPLSPRGASTLVAPNASSTLAPVRSVPTSRGTSNSVPQATLSAEKRSTSPSSETLKLARLTTSAASTREEPTRVEERPEPRLVEKVKAEYKLEPKVDVSKRRTAAVDIEEQEAVRPKKQTKETPSSSKTEKKSQKPEEEPKSEKEKPPVLPPAKMKPKKTEDSEQSSLPPDQTLRKLFNPHG